MTAYGVPAVGWFAASAAVVAAGACAVGYATAADASARGIDSPLQWGVICGAFVPAAVGYWWRRDRSGPRSDPPTSREVAARAVALAAVTGLLVSAVFGPPDVVSLSVGVVAVTVVALPVAYLFTRR